MIRVGVLRGGTSNEYEQSLKSGAYVLQHLPRDRYEVLDIFIDQEGVWHLGGRPVNFDRLRHRVDVLWNSLHGFYGEDGKVQQLLENLSIPYIGAGPFSSALAMHKKMFKDHLVSLGQKTPRGAYVESWGEGSREETVAGVVSAVGHDFSPPWIVEPINRAYGMGPVRAKTRDELARVLGDMYDLRIPVLVEEEVLGAHASVIVVPGFRGQKHYAFLPVRLESEHAKLRRQESELLESVAKKVHEGLHLGSYSRMIGVIDNRGGVSVLEVETVPRLHEDAELHRALAAVGSSFPELAEHLIREALERE